MSNSRSAGVARQAASDDTVSSRVSVRLPDDLHADLDALVEEGHFFHRSEVIRSGLRRVLNAPDVQARSLDVHLLHEVGAQPDNTYDFTILDMAEDLNVSASQLTQTIRAHEDLDEPLVAIEQWSDGSSREALWRATPRVSVTIPPGAPGSQLADRSEVTDE